MRDDPFAKLGALDQKLFGSRPTTAGTTSVEQPVPESPPVPVTVSDSQAEPTTANTPPSLPPSLLIRKEGRRETEKERGREASPLPEPDSPTVFDLNSKPYRKDSYLFTNEEFEAMEDLKIELRRKFDLRATKNDIARCALGYLLSDFQHRRETSIVVRQLQKKK